MPLNDAMNTILPPRYGNGRKYKPKITTDSDGMLQDFHAPRKRRDQKWHSHGGVDMNYHYDSGAPIGQNGINREHPTVHSPVSGTVTDARPESGRVEITDENGFRHQLRHLDKTTVEKGARVVAGQKIGTMGGRGPRGADEYQQHVHYTIRSPYGLEVDPEKYWGMFYSDAISPDKNGPMTPAGLLESHVQQKLKDLPQGITIASGETLRREGDKVWRIERDGSTRGYFISQ